MGEVVYGDRKIDSDCPNVCETMYDQAGNPRRFCVGTESEYGRN